MEKEPLLGELAEEYLEVQARRPLASSTRNAYQRGVNQFVRFLTRQGRRHAASIRPADLTEFRIQILARLARHPLARGTPPGLVTVDDLTRTARRFCQWLVVTRRLILDPSVHLEPIRLKRSIPRVLSRVEVDRLLSVPTGGDPVAVRDRAILELLYSSGLRCGELVELDLGDLDLAGGEVVVRRGKGGMFRRAPLGECAADALGRYLQEAREEFLVERSVRPTDPGAVFLSQWGTRLSKLLVSRMVRRRAEAARLEGRITTHALRHTAALHLLQGGASIRDVQLFLGHRSLDTTAHYTRLLIDDLKECHRRAHPRGDLGE